MARRSRRRSKRLENSEVSLTPMIDVAFTLLIIFMIATPIMRNGIKITLPDGSAQEMSGEQQEFVVHINEQGQIFFNELLVSMDRLIPTIQEKMGSNTKQTVFVRADKSVPYGKVISVVDQIKVVGGVDYVALATQTPAQV